MLFKHYCQKKTTNFIQTFLEHPLLWHYCIHLPEDQHPLLGWLIVILTSLDSLQLLPLGIFLSQFQFPLHFPYSGISYLCTLTSTMSSNPHLTIPFLTVPIFLLVSWTTNRYSPLFAQPPHLYLTPAADLPFLFFWDIFPNSFSCRLKVFNQSQSSLDLILSSQINLLRKIPVTDWQITQKIEERQSLSFSTGLGTTEVLSNWK